MSGSATMHVPVMPDRVAELLAPALDSPDALAVDGTLGMGGHAAALLSAHPGLRLIGIDRDESALRHSERRLAPFADRVEFLHAPYDELDRILDERGIGTVSGILLDLGVSSPQLDEAHRGFAYSHDAPLDMRMDRSQPRTAADIVNTYSAAELARILREYGEERFARRVAGAIVRERARVPIESTLRLAELVRDAIPAATRRTGKNPAKRTFQALRIEVNDEIAILERALRTAVHRIGLGGRLVVLSYHSLEDRAAKRVLAAGAIDRTPPDLPVSLPDHRPELRLLSSGAERPSEEECRRNPRATSARLRAAERIREPR